MDGGVNPAQGDAVRAELIVETQTVNFHREPPPPYTASVTAQPIVHQTIIVQPPLKAGPIYYTCPQCKERVLTKVKYVNSRKTHLCAGFVCGFTLWCMLCCLAAIPYLVPTFKKAQHYCPNCDILLGTYSKV